MIILFKCWQSLCWQDPDLNTNIDTYLAVLRRNVKSVFITLTSEVEVIRLIDNLWNKHSSGYDNINNVLLKELCPLPSKPLSMLFNKSITEGVFPYLMKLAQVVPLHKGQCNQNVSNYRPISFLLTISKLLEKVVYSRIYGFLNDNDQIYRSQYGFWSNCNCEHAINELTSEIQVRNG